MGDPSVPSAFWTAPAGINGRPSDACLWCFRSCGQFLSFRLEGWDGLAYSTCIVVKTSLFFGKDVKPKLGVCCTRKSIVRLNVETQPGIKRSEYQQRMRGSPRFFLSINLYVLMLYLNIRSPDISDISEWWSRRPTHPMARIQNRWQWYFRIVDLHTDLLFIHAGKEVDV